MFYITNSVNVGDNAPQESIALKQQQEEESLNVVLQDCFTYEPLDSFGKSNIHTIEHEFAILSFVLSCRLYRLYLRCLFAVCKKRVSALPSVSQTRIYLRLRV